MEYIAVAMTRDDLDAIPEHPLPGGYALRPYVEGDRDTWVSIWQACEPFLTITPETFDHEFGSDLPAMDRRCTFLAGPDGDDVGTITSWYERSHRGKAWGRIHWVAVVPDHQGQGLAKPMMTAAMKRMRALGHRRALLGTQIPRLAAIKTYLDFGFRPDMTTDDADRAWKLVQDALGHPALGDI